MMPNNFEKKCDRLIGKGRVNDTISVPAKELKNLFNEIQRLQEVVDRSNDTCYVVTIKEGLATDVTECYPEDVEMIFLDHCNVQMSNFSDYTRGDIDAIIDQGYEKYGNGNAVCMVTE